MRVFPVPGGPNSRIPRTCFMPENTENVINNPALDLSGMVGTASTVYLVFFTVI